MKILYCTGALKIGGTEIYTLNMIRVMREKGHEVTWASSKGELYSQIKEEGINFIKCNLNSRNPVALMLSIYRVRKIIKKEQYDIVHCVDAHSALIVSQACKYLRNKPKIVWSCVGIGVISYLLMFKLCSKRIDCIIAVSQYIRNRLIEVGFLPEVIYIAHEPRIMKKPSSNLVQIRNELGIENNEIVIGSIGRVVKEKGYETIIRALPLILEKYDTVKLVIVGDGRDINKFRELSKQLKVSKHVIFTGMRRDVENLYSIFDIFAFPTYMEASGNVAFEAMSIGVPIIASYTGGIPEAITNGENGLLVTTAVCKEWAEAICKLIENPELMNSMVERGKDVTNNKYSYKEATNKLLKIYDVLGGR